jgi:hypothetical protein
MENASHVSGRTGATPTRGFSKACNDQPRAVQADELVTGDLSESGRRSLSGRAARPALASIDWVT